MAHLRPIDKEFEDADDTGVLVLSSRNLRNFPVVPGDLCDFNDLLEAGNNTQYIATTAGREPCSVCNKELVYICKCLSLTLSSIFPWL